MNGNRLTWRRLGGACLLALVAVSAPAEDGAVSVFGLRGFSGGLDGTSFSCRCDGGRLRFRFDVRDETPCAPSARDLPERVLEDYDRVEVFLSPSADMAKRYCCIEIGVAGDVLDYRASYYRQMDYAFALKTLTVRAASTADGYVVEGSVALSELAGEGLDPRMLHMGVFRADYAPGGRLVDWYSARPHGPGEPDFHRPCHLFSVNLVRD